MGADLASTGRPLLPSRSFDFPQPIHVDDHEGEPQGKRRARSNSSRRRRPAVSWHSR